VDRDLLFVAPFLLMHPPYHPHHSSDASCACECVSCVCAVFSAYLTGVGLLSGTYYKKSLGTPAVCNPLPLLLSRPPASPSLLRSTFLAIPLSLSFAHSRLPSLFLLVLRCALPRSVVVVVQWLAAGATALGGVSTIYHYNRFQYYRGLSNTYPFFKHDFPRKDYKGIDAE
jgi:hypothetical protein